LVAVAALSFPAAVRWEVRRAAERAGFRASIEGVALGVGRVWVSGVAFQSQRLPGFNGRLQDVEVRVGLAGVEGVTLHGGEVRIAATRTEVVQAFRGRGSGGSASGPQHKTVDGRGLFVEWVGGPQKRIALWGVGFARESDGYAISVDAARVAYPGLDVELRAAQATVDRSLQIREVAAVKTTAVVDMDHVATAESPPSAGAGPGNQSDARASSTEQGPVGVLLRLDETRGPKLRARVAQFSGVVARRLPEGSALDLSGVRLRLKQGGSGLSLGPARVRLAREPGHVFFSFEPMLEVDDKQHFSMTARLPIDSGESEIEVEGGPVRLSSLGVREGDLGLAGVSSARVQVKAEMVLSDDGSRISASSSGRVDGLSVSNPRLGRLPLSGISLGWDARGSLLTDGSEVSIDSGDVSLGAVHVNVELALKRQQKDFTLSTRLRVPLGSCSEMLASLPKNLVPFADQMRLSGTFSWSMALGVDSQRLADMDLDWHMQNDCRFESVPRELSPEQFKSPFMRQVPDVDGQPLTVIAGPGTDSWVPISEVSRFLEAAVLVSEDGRFWRHHGFDQHAIESSIRQNVQAGRFLRGASTISMQLAKNLYLTREKTVTRKIQEALLTMLLEQRLRKDEILELYFNVVELAPGVYGVGPGADYYFHTVPADLSVAQSFFLASVLPNPGSERFDEAGNLKPYWRSYIDRLMKIAADRGRITQADLERGLDEQVRFGVPATDAWPEHDVEQDSGEFVPF
jgi:hypothetical protein